MTTKVSIKQINLANSTDTELVSEFQVNENMTVSQFLTQLQKDIDGKFFVLKSNKKDRAAGTLLVKDCIVPQNELFLQSKQQGVKIIKIDSSNNQSTLEDQYLVDITITVSKFSTEISTKFSTTCTVLKQDKSNNASLELPLQNFINAGTVYVKTTVGKILLYQIISQQQEKLLQVINQNTNMKVSEFTQKIKDDFGYDLILYQKDKSSRASVNRKISELLSGQKLYAKSMLVSIVVFCEKNAKLPKYTIKADLSWTVTQLKQKNSALSPYDILDTKNNVVQGAVKLSEAVQTKGKDRYLKYAEINDQKAKEARIAKMNETLARLEKINTDVKKLASQNTIAANAKMAQSAQRMQGMMEELKKDVNYIKEKDFSLSEKIRATEKQESATFISRLYKVAELYGADMLLQQNSSRIFWPYYKNMPFTIRKRIIDFTKSKIETTNVNHYEQRQTTTHFAATVQKIERQITSHFDSLSTSAKVGFKTSFVSASLEASYSEQNQAKTDAQSNTMSNYTKQYVIFNALKKSQAYHIDEQNIVLKQYIRDNVKQLFSLYEKKDPKFELKAKLFFRNYGTHLQVGKYTFGCRYSFNSMAQSDQQVTEKKLAKASRTVKSMGMAASVEGGGLFFSASGGFSIQSTKGSSQSNLNQQKQGVESYSFEINYNLEGLEVKNRDTWRQLSGIYRKGWRCLGFEDLRLVRIVNILRNKGNQIQNPSFKATYEQFLDKMSDIQLKLTIDDYSPNEDGNQGQISANLDKNGYLPGSSQASMKRDIISYVQKKVGTIQYEQPFKMKLDQLLSSNKQIDYVQWLSGDSVITVRKQILESATIGQKIAQVDILIQQKK